MNSTVKRFFGMVTTLVLPLMACSPAIKIPTSPAGAELVFGLSDGNTVGTPIWSPSGQALAFTTFNPRDGNTQIHIMNLATREVNTLVELMDVRAQSWSPDGRMIAYNSGREIWIVPADGGVAPKMLASGQVVAYSPDGEQMAIFDNAGTATPGTYVLRILDLQTGIEKTVFSANVGNHTIFDLSWAPDDMRLAFSLSSEDADIKNEARDIYIYNLNLEKLSRFTDGDHNFFPTWSPSGNQIAYLHRPIGESSASIIISQIDVNCSIEVPDINGVSSLAWSPDGSYLAYSLNTGIYLLDLEEVFGTDFASTGPQC